MSMCVCVYTYVCFVLCVVCGMHIWSVQVCGSVHMYEEAIEGCWVPLSNTHCLISLKQDLSLNQKLIILAALTSQQALRDSPVSSSQCWGYRHVHPCLTFIWVLGIWTQVFMLALPVLLPTVPSSQPQVFFCFVFLSFRVFISGSTLWLLFGLSQLLVSAVLGYGAQE